MLMMMTLVSDENEISFGGDFGSFTIGNNLKKEVAGKNLSPPSQ